MCSFSCSSATRRYVALHITLAGCRDMLIHCKMHIITKLSGMAMERIVLVGFLECSNRWSCKLHPFGCRNSLVLNRDDWGVGAHLRLRMTNAVDKLAWYSIGSDGSDGCRVGFTAREYAAGGKDRGWTELSLRDSKNRSMHRLYHPNRGYVYAIVLNWIGVVFKLRLPFL